ncbi:MAG: SDR family oxidoreductase [Actinobacteria bacterium]|nr:SDR family oxidoreductase [Actinomycetota bacterium]MCL5070877.1 SDR family oxidoreductase [Actinomycetota bacterium]
MNELKDKYAVITGASGGIGAATAVAFAMEGARGIIITDVDREGAEKVVNKIISEIGTRCEFIEANIGESKDIKKLFKTCIDYFGRLDILVNCAGICNNFKIEEIDESQWDKLMSINLRGTYLCCRGAFEIMKKQQSGKIINVSSISGRIGGIATGIDYATSKGGIITLTMSFAKAAGPYGINVNAVAPGFIDTEMTRDFTHFDSEIVPLRRSGKPEDVADVITFLAGNKSRYITGVTIDVNGGMFMG